MSPDELRRLADYIRKCAADYRPLVPYIDTTGYEQAIEQIRKMR